MEMAVTKRDGRKLSLPRSIFYPGVVFVLVVFFFGIWLISSPGGIRWAPESGAMASCRGIALAMFQYAQDHDGAYPDGASSTEVFQKLLDGNYVSDSVLFYQSLPGKTRALKGRKLKPENVAYDVTSGVQATSSANLPIVFLTGFRIEYRPGGSAVSLVRPFPKTALHLADLFTDHGIRTCLFDGFAVAYKNNNAWYRESNLGSGHPTQFTSDGYGIVPKVVDAKFDAAGRTYTQLTPEGLLR